MIKTFIIHVSKGYEERRKHIDTHLPERGITEYEYMLRGDIDDLSDSVRNEFFADNLTLAQKSCTYKHYLVMKKVVKERIPQALVLEDDALLVDGFVEKLALLREELTDKRNYIVNIEEASNSVPWSVRIDGQLLYPCKVNKLGGGLFFDLAFAEKIVTFIESQIIDAPIDGLLGNVRDIVGYNLMWSQPSLVVQGSKNGMFASELSQEAQGIAPYLKSLFKDNYRKHVRSHISKKQKMLFIDVKHHD
ncbi:glycosyltransferase family 25 protein [Thaumasiovibrio sp. DFM-14]|uniref:glycosyltransferase family 25 protein n=1 Tax=Thaumasiovibrio sp. DFM-14 TaxID=3384792 RepID=UPI0039A013AF